MEVLIKHMFFTSFLTSSICMIHQSGADSLKSRVDFLKRAVSPLDFDSGGMSVNDGQDIP